MLEGRRFRRGAPPRSGERGVAVVRALQVLTLVGSAAAAAALAAPTIPTDVELPGTQPTEVGPYVPPTNCDNCHAGTPDPSIEPFFGWQGSMMSHAGRDPLFWAQLAIVEQDFLPNADVALRGGGGDFCLRCHMPNGWLGGRSTPTDGSGMSAATDANGVECEHCHLLVNPDPPVNVSGTVEMQNVPFIANDGVDGYYGSGMYVINSEGTRLGPYDIMPAIPAHGTKQSGFHRESAMCGTCHDVSNPIVGDLAHNFGAQVPLTPGSYSGVLGGPVADKAAFNNPPHKYGVVERTYSEWVSSAFSTLLVNDFATLPADLQVAGGILKVARNRAWDGSTANYADGTSRVYSCQTCHMSAAEGVGCTQPGTPTRTDLPRHDLTGSGYWVPSVIQYMDDQGTLLFGGPVPPDQRTAMNAGRIRAEQILRAAASLSATQIGDDVQVKVVNLTGHKLITGYPEGRRMWLNVRWLDGGGGLIAENGAYGQIGRAVDDLALVAHSVESLIDPGNTVIFDAGPAMDQQWSNQLIGFGLDTGMALAYDRLTDAVTETLGTLDAKPAGSRTKTFHFVLNNVLDHDTRIPPYGFDYDKAAARNALPVPTAQYGGPGAGGTYDYWSLSDFDIPAGAETTEVRLYYQQTSWEYIQFLWLQNDQQNGFLGQEGVNLLDAWLNTGMSPPLEMEFVSIPLDGPPGEASIPAMPADQMLAGYNGGTGDIDVTYTAACDATDHTIYYGPLGSVSSHAYGGAECWVGTTGSASFNPGSGDYFFVVVGLDGSAEGSYGHDSAGYERTEDSGTATCDTPQLLTSICLP